MPDQGKKFMRVILLVVLIFISGYSFAGTKDKTSQCLEGLKSDAKFSSIASHLELDGQSTGTMLADKARPDGLQKGAIADWIDARSACVNLSPSQVAIGLHMAFLSIVTDLYNGQETFGEFNKKWQELFNEVTKIHGKQVN